MGPERNEHGEMHSWLKYCLINQRRQGNKGREPISLKIAAEPPQDGDVVVWGSLLISLLLFLPSGAAGRAGGGCQPGGRWCRCAPCLGSGCSHPCRRWGRVLCCAVLGCSELLQPGCGAPCPTSPRAVAWREPGRIVLGRAATRPDLAQRCAPPHADAARGALGFASCLAVLRWAHRGVLHPRACCATVRVSRGSCRWLAALC